ncbi:MAG: hypothetical protein L0241_11130 [Planctomycetia bacterium]|nr:hypothetical protein [Planctomycetia bacterium]
MRKTQLIVLFVVGAGVAAGAGTLAARWSSWFGAQSAPPPPVAQPELVIDPQYLDFGEVWEAEQFEWKAPVHNRTETTIHVFAFNNSCGSCGAASSTTLIPVSGTGEVRFKIDLRNPCASAEPQAIRDVKIQVYLRKDSSPGTPLVPVELRGRVKSAIVVNAKTIDFGRFPVTANPKPRVVPIRALRELRDLSATVDGHSVQAELKPTESGKWELHVRPVVAASVGRHTATVRLTPTTASGEKVPSVNLPVAFDVLQDIQPDTSLVPLGAGQVGETLCGTLTVSSLSNRPFARPTCDTGELSVLAVTTPPTPQASYTFKFERKITAIGNHTAPVVIRGNDADGRPFELRIDMQWYGVTP